MAIARITGQMLNNNLDRSGTPLAIDGNLVYFDVNSRYVGINTDAPAYPLDLIGNAHLGNIYILGNTITTDNGQVTFGNIGNVHITGGSMGYVVVTEGNGNLSFAEINSLPEIMDILSNVTAANLHISTIDANVGAYEIWANAELSGIHSDIYGANVTIESIQANVGAYEIYGNANIGTLYLGNISTQANLGAYQTYANANIGTLYLGNISTQANLGAYQEWANANAVTQDTQITSLASGANTNTAAYLSNGITTDINTTGNIFVGNISSYSITSNVGYFTTLTAIEATITSGNITGLSNLASQAATITTANVETAYVTLANIDTANISTADISTANIVALTAVDIYSTFHGNVYTTNIYNSNYDANINLIPGTGGIVSMETAAALTLPVGGNVGRPAYPVTGQIRYNTEEMSIEYYNGLIWFKLNPTVTNQTFTGGSIGNGGVATYTLTSPTTEAGVMVSINGVVQVPGIAYQVAGDQLTFTEAPLQTDIIDVRFLAAGAVPKINDLVIDTPPISVTDTPAIVDFFNSTIYRSAKYVISSVNNPGNDASMNEILLTHINGNVYTTVTGINTGSNSISYTANVSGLNINLIATGTSPTNLLTIQATYFTG